LRNKYLRDVCKALKDKDFLATAKPLQRILQSVKPLKIKHLLKFFFAVLQWIGKTCPKTQPLPLPTDQSVSWHDFCTQPTRHFYTFFYHCKTAKQKTKNQSNH